MFHMGQPDNLGKDLNLTAAQLGRNGGGGGGGGGRTFRCN